MKPSLVLLLLLHALACTVSIAQDSTAGKSITAIPAAYFDKVSKKQVSLTVSLIRKQKRY